jgi:hypothetical protein
MSILNGGRAFDVAATKAALARADDASTRNARLEAEVARLEAADGRDAKRARSILSPPEHPEAGSTVMRAYEEDGRSFSWWKGNVQKKNTTAKGISYDVFFYEDGTTERKLSLPAASRVCEGGPAQAGQWCLVTGDVPTIAEVL